MTSKTENCLMTITKCVMVEAEERVKQAKVNTWSLENTIEGKNQESFIKFQIL